MAETVWMRCVVGGANTRDEAEQIMADAVHDAPAEIYFDNPADPGSMSLAERKAHVLTAVRALQRDGYAPFSVGDLIGDLESDDR